jgi:hypothetical protein
LKSSNVSSKWDSQKVYDADFTEERRTTSITPPIVGYTDTHGTDFVETETALPRILGIYLYASTPADSNKSFQIIVHE